MSMKNRIREIRQLKNMTQLELSYATRIAPTNISMIERGRQYCFPGWRKKISEALGFSESEVFEIDSRNVFDDK